VHLQAAVAGAPTVAAAQLTRGAEDDSAMRRPLAPASPATGARVQPDARSVIVGTVTDTARRPLAGVSLSLDGESRSAVSDSGGAFLLAQLPGGAYRLRARRLGYAEGAWSARVAPGDTLRATLTLVPLPPTLDTVTVSAAAPVRGHLATWESRRDAGVKMGLGRFIDRAEIEKSEHSTLASLIRQRAPGLRFASRCGGTFFGSRSGSLSGGRGNGPLFQGCELPADVCYGTVLLDGVLLYRNEGRLRVEANGSSRPPPPPNLERLVALNQVEGIEIYRGATDTPSELKMGGGACGTIAIWTRIR
jgi:hypothetical protein